MAARPTLAIRLFSLALAVIAAQAALPQQPAGRRPLTHKDYASWRTIQTPQLSRDGKFLAYGLFPQEGDGELVVRDLMTGKERREAAGAIPAAPDVNPLELGHRTWSGNRSSTEESPQSR